MACYFDFLDDELRIRADEVTDILLQVTFGQIEIDELGNRDVKLYAPVEEGRIVFTSKFKGIDKSTEHELHRMLQKIIDRWNWAFHFRQEETEV